MCVCVCVCVGGGGGVGGRIDLNFLTEARIYSDQTPSDKKRFNEKFRESLELYMNPNIHDSPKKGGGGGQNSNSDNSRKGSEGQQGTDQDGLFRSVQT